MSDDDYETFWEFEDDAWRFINGSYNDTELPDDVDNGIRLVWSGFSTEEQNSLITSSENFMGAQADYEAAERAVTLAMAYSGSPGDNDTYGKETTRPSFGQYERSKNHLLEALRRLSQFTRELQAQRSRLGFPHDQIGHHGEEYLADMLVAYELAGSTCYSELQDIPKQRQAAREKLAERKRIAEGSLNSLWEGKWPLQEGTYGTASLYVKQGPAGRIVDYVVIKESDFKEKPHIWGAPELWTGWRGPQDSTSIPNEVQAMLNLRDKIGSESIVRIRNWRIRRAEKYHRLYLEFATRGDFFDLVCDNNNAPYWKSSAFRARFPEVDTKTSQYQIAMLPEPFLWSAFFSLATAGLLMERGELDAEQANPTTWESIVHRDLKLGNVFLSWDSTERWRGYPSVKVADFGLALMMPFDNVKRREDYTWKGTNGNCAPEQVKVLPVKDGPSVMMSAKTNVWSMGIVMWSLLMGKEGLRGPQYEQWNNDQIREVPRFNLTARLYYSNELLSMIYRCLRYNVDERPTFDELLNYIKEMTGDGQFDMDFGLRDAPADDPKWQEHKLEYSRGSNYVQDMLLRDLAAPAGRTYGEAPAADAKPVPEDMGGPAGTEVIRKDVYIGERVVDESAGSAGAGTGVASSGPAGAGTGVASSPFARRDTEGESSESSSEDTARRSTESVHGGARLSPFGSR